MDRVQTALTEKLRKKIADHRKDLTVIDRSPLYVPVVDRGRFSIRMLVDGRLTVFIAITDILTEKVFWELETDDEERAIARYIEIISDPLAWVNAQEF